jgi:hypothetical protein
MLEPSEPSGLKMKAPDTIQVVILSLTAAIAVPMPSPSLGPRQIESPILEAAHPAILLDVCDTVCWFRFTSYWVKS